MTNNKPSLIERARDLLTCDELRGRVPDEVQAFLRDVVALEPVSDFHSFTSVEVRDPHHGGYNLWQWRRGRLHHKAVGCRNWVEVKRLSPTPSRILAVANLLTLGAPNDPA